MTCTPNPPVDPAKRANGSAKRAARRKAPRARAGIHTPSHLVKALRQTPSATIGAAGYGSRLARRCLAGTTCFFYLHVDRCVCSALSAALRLVDEDHRRSLFNVVSQ